MPHVFANYRIMQHMNPTNQHVAPLPGCLLLGLNDNDAQRRKQSKRTPTMSYASVTFLFRLTKKGHADAISVREVTLSIREDILFR
jgi:hypothetical protein